MEHSKPDLPRVHYRQTHDGRFDITIQNPDAKDLRINGYPGHIRAAVQKSFHATITLEERSKLRAAEDIGEPAYTAVWDDLVSARADDMLRTKAPLPGTLENGRHGLSSHHYESYLETELER